MRFSERPRFSDITEDGTYWVGLTGNLTKESLTTGYMVGVKALNPVEGDNSDIIPPLTLVGRWTNYLEDVPNGPGEFDYDTVNVVYWDKVEVIDNLLDAGNIARQRGELAIWDNLNNTEIRV